MANTNLALDGTASQSSTGFGGVASRAIDGNTNGAYGGGSVTHTNGGAFNFWQVQLAKESNIDQIVIHNRTDCCQSRTGQFRVSVFDGNPDAGGTEVFAFNNPGALGNAPLSIDVQGMDPNVRGNYVRVAIDPAANRPHPGRHGSC